MECSDRDIRRYVNVRQINTWEACLNGEKKNFQLQLILYFLQGDSNFLPVYPPRSATSNRSRIGQSIKEALGVIKFFKTNSTKAIQRRECIKFGKACSF